MDLARYKAEIGKLAHRRRELDGMGKDVERRAKQADASRQALAQLEAFCGQVSLGLEAMTFQERQQLLRLVVEGITVKDGWARIETIIPIGQDGKLRNPRGELVEP